MITIERYRGKRFWAVYEDGALLCLTVYKKGAKAVKERLEAGYSVAESGKRSWSARGGVAAARLEEGGSIYN
jgi:hypothetical protein